MSRLAHPLLRTPLSGVSHGDGESMMTSKLIATLARATVASAGIGLGVLLSGPSAQADIISGSTTGLASPATTLTFDEVVLAPGAPVTNQYAAFGVTFSNVFYTPQTGTGAINF